MAEQENSLRRFLFSGVRFALLLVLIIYILFGSLFFTIPFYPFNPLVGYRHIRAQGLSKRSILDAALWGLGSFSVEEWKAALPTERNSYGEYTHLAGKALAKRRRMANDFLAREGLVEMTVTDLKSLLGEQDYEHDVWDYYLSDKGALPRELIFSPPTVTDEYPYLYIMFKNGKTHRIGIGGKVIPGDPFDSDDWKKKPAAERFDMASALSQDKTLIGLTKQDLEQLLGKPDHTDPEHTIDYDLGIPRLDVVTLTFFLGPDERIIRAGIFEH
jgi:hypothetical protein